MKRLLIGFLIVGSMSSAHVGLNQKQAIESLKAHIIELRLKIAARLKGKDDRSLDTARRKAIEKEISELSHALEVSENSLKPLQLKK